MNKVTEAKPQAGEPYVLVSETGAEDGRKYFFHQVIENEAGDKIGCSRETWPIGWRAEEALLELSNGSVEKAAGYIEEILREVNLAECRNVPCLAILPTNATITEDGKYLVSETMWSTKGVVCILRDLGFDEAANIFENAAANGPLN
jgi:hypothetical protein